MKNIISITLFLSSLMFVGCSNTPAPPMSSDDVATIGYTKFGKVIPLTKSKKLIFKAGEEAGWKMTEFGERAMLAEKLHDNSDATSVTIHFNKDGFELEPSNSDLQSLLEDKFN